MQLYLYYCFYIHKLLLPRFQCCPSIYHYSIGTCSDLYRITTRALQLLSTITQSEFCIVLLVLKNIFGYSVVLCKVKQKKSINSFAAVNIAHDIANELKCLREKTNINFTSSILLRKKTAKTEGFILETPRLTSRQTNRCNIAVEQMKNILE